MELSVIFGAAAVFALIWLAAHPKPRGPRGRADRPRAWDGAAGMESAAWLGLSGGGDAGAAHFDGGHHSSTNAPSDGGGFDGGGGGDGGGGDGG